VTIVLRLSVSKDFVILDCVFLTQCQRVTDRRTENSTVANTMLTLFDDDD